MNIGTSIKDEMPTAEEDSEITVLVPQNSALEPPPEETSNGSLKSLGQFPSQIGTPAEEEKPQISQATGEVDLTLMTYMREIGLYKLLMPEEENTFAYRIELARNLKSIQSKLADSDKDTDVEIALSIVKSLCSRAESIASLDRCRLFISDDFKPTPHITLSIFSQPEVRRILDKKFDERVIEEFSDAMECSEEESRDELTRLSVESALMPSAIVAILGHDLPLQSIPSALEKETVRKEIIRKKGSLREHFAGVIESGKNARCRLTESNLRLVVAFAKRYNSRGVPLPDLIQEGNLGLLKAVDKYNYRLGYRFSTYASWWIRQSISRSLALQARVIRIPVQMEETINKIQNFKTHFLQEHGREPEMADLLANVSAPGWRILESIKYMREPTSLEASIGENGRSTFIDLIEDENQPSPQDEAATSFLRDYIDAVLDELPRRDKQVITMRYGLHDGKEHTLNDVGKVLGLTRERIRQIENATLNKIRRKARKLKDFIDDADG